MADVPAPNRGRDATHPGEIPAAGWKDVLARTRAQVKRDNIGLLSAGVAFYALLALVPGLVGLVSLYGLVADPTEVESQVGDLLGAAPGEVRDLISTQLSAIVDGPRAGLGLGVAVGLALALWSASSGMKHLITAVNIAYDEQETRGFLKVRALSLGFTAGALVFLVLAFGAVALLPALLAGTGLGDAARLVVGILRWPALAVALMVGLSVLYRYAPVRDNARWAWVSVGAVAATGAWILSSIAFSAYTASFADYNETYGSLGAVVVVMLWLFLTVFVVVCGAELNAELERQTARDTTDGAVRPLGRRDAHAADTVGPTADELRRRWEQSRPTLQRS